LDVGFFWRLMKALAAARPPREKSMRVRPTCRAYGRTLTTGPESGRRQVAKALRPFYIDYLKQNGIDGVN
jgi:hypothetical protein